MTNEEAIAIIQNEYKCVDRDCDIERSCGKCNLMTPNKEPILEAYKLAIKALEQQPCEMTTEEYRQRMIQTFHNADTDELIAVCVLPTEKEFEHLEWLLKNHYKKAPCDDAVSRKAVFNAIEREDKWLLAAKGHNELTEMAFSGLKARIDALLPVTQKSGKCKNCKWWRDSDGVYRRGVGAESQCPINRREVYEGNGYCYMFEPQESEE